MDYLLYIDVFIVTTHCIFTVMVYGKMMCILTKKVECRKDWTINRVITIVLALFVPIVTIIIIYFDVEYRNQGYYYKFFYPYDDLQQQECDATHLVDIWTGSDNISKYIKADWEKLNEYFNNFGTHLHDPG